MTTTQQPYRPTPAPKLRGPRVSVLQASALWMRVVANACGYTPEVARPLGFAYAYAKRYTGKYREWAPDDPDIEFGGLGFEEVREGIIDSCGIRYTTAVYNKRVKDSFPDAWHDRLLATIYDVVEQLDIERMDTSAAGYDLFRDSVQACRRQTPMRKTMPVLLEQWARKIPTLRP